MDSVSGNTRKSKSARKERRTCASFLSRTPCINSIWVRIEIRRRGADSMALAALAFPRWTQMRTSVSKITEASTSKSSHGLSHGLVCVLVGSKEGMGLHRRGNGSPFRDDRPLGFAVIQDANFLSALQGFQYARHPVAQIENGCVQRGASWKMDTSTIHFRYG